MNNRIIKWQNTAVILECSSDTADFFGKNGVVVRREQRYYSISNSKNVWLFEEEFINESSHTLQNIFDKLSHKDYSNIRYFDTISEKFCCFPNDNDSDLYSKIISLNVIDGINTEKLNISVSLLSLGNYDIKSKRVRQLINIYMLLLLANRSKRTGINSFNFIFEEEMDSFSYEVEFGKNDFDSSLLDVYNWIIDNYEYTESYKVKLQIVRGLIAKQKNLNGLNSLKYQSESIFNRIISGKTDKYFELQKNLKDDFLRISTSIRDYNSSLQTKLFGWLTALSVIIFDFIKSSDGQKLFKRIIFSTSEKTQVLLIVLLIALIVIIIMFNLDIKSIRKEYNAIREYYVKQMLVSESEIEELIKEPQYLNLYNTLLFILFLSIVFRLKFAF